MVVKINISVACFGHFPGEARGRVTWNRTALDSFQAGFEPTWNRTHLTLASQDCPGGYSLVGDKCLMFVTFAAEPYQGARFFCHAARGELAAITTPTDFKNLVDYIHANGFFGQAFWLDGTKIAAKTMVSHSLSQTEFQQLLKEYDKNIFDLA
ncbi:uncharacterized protein LOC134776104 [Penaeus indicus]|uniref:uncharacterized protein LOC134776104 n=1 Tax=Penaeus indicus TaxID=29960 RepID=UPI00300C1D2F